MAKISIIGTGHVGASFAYSLALGGLATELLLVDEADRTSNSSESGFIRESPRL